jgi:hypothetical protein
MTAPLAPFPRATRPCDTNAVPADRLDEEDDIGLGAQQRRNPLRRCLASNTLLLEAEEAGPGLMRDTLVVRPDMPIGQLRGAAAVQRNLVAV